MAAAPHQPFAFLEAASRGDLDVMKRLAKEDESLINAKGSFDVWEEAQGGTTALMVAVAYGHVEIVIWLLDHGADMAAKDDDGRDVLFHAAFQGRLLNLSMLVEKGANVMEGRANKGSTPLMVAAQQGHFDIATYLLDQGVDLSAKDDKGMDALLFASLNGHLPIVVLLNEKGANLLESRANDGQTPLIAAAEEGHVETVAYLLDQGADINTKVDHVGDALIAASAGGHLPVVRLLIERGADLVDSQTNDGQTPLSIATALGHVEMMAHILNQGIGTNGIDAVE